LLTGAVIAMRGYRSVTLALLCGWALFMTQAATAADGAEQAEPGRLRLHVVFNNVPHRAGLETAWGFSCLIEGLDRTVLFDTGGNGDVLLTNMRRLGLDPGTVDAIVLSHIHGDHTGGLGALLARNPGVVVYMPASFPASFLREVERFGAATETVSGPRGLMERVHTTGEMGAAPGEQGLILDTPEGLVVITGCAHPDIADMAERARGYLGRKIHLLMGGFHLGHRGDGEIRAIIGRLKSMGVERVAPSHCTGDRAMGMFRDAWADDFVEGGLGAVIEVPSGN
jgi:7,8-dihydropterin-6-yl-methyl-4-(beta-D-ribofuranosyl)aminobenzene 5'-phosphate synthase